MIEWHKRLHVVIGRLNSRPCLIADAGFMYAAKMSGEAALYDLFTPDVGELAFLADEEAPHPFYTRGFILHEENRVPDLITRAYKHHNAARYLLVKGEKDYLADESGEIPAIIGERTAKNNKLTVGDFVTIRWRDVNGTFDANEVKIVHIFKTNVPPVDLGVVWIPLEKHREMVQMPNEATILTSSQEAGFIGSISGWEFKDHYFLLTEIREMIEMKSIGGAVFFVILMSLAMLAIFDTQVLSIFRRQKEIGTHIALGMTQRQVVTLFTVEGAMHSILAAILAAIYGIPLLGLQAKVGWSMPAGTDDFGMTIAETIYPAYTLGLVLGTTLLVLATTTFVSYIPARRISRMNPTDAIRGKIQ